MSYYFTIIGTRDNPLFEHVFGTSKASGDGLAHFRPEARHLNQFIVHAALDIVDEVQWTTGAMFLKTVDRFQGCAISAFVTGTNVRFLLLCDPEPSAAQGKGGLGVGGEEAVRQFYAEVYESWVKTALNPFYSANMEVKSPVFRARVAAAGRKYL